ncbi:class III lanthionine synthetase LanKC [Streptomyces sp. WMMC500]|uniref:class III lanthionine synthetase LanKC n=1 Tax=Streptomyces sp. WMMC500 TaxID=3015154 RepID=UPI00248ACE18|nr:class III lanthionine synthetase LanKC [Streptomyces sp. WMMC500]WBB58431.1 class III lanthionine synthetase LanKC [Streptomyces sp. WMMC500]
MKLNYIEYCLADRNFYDEPDGRATEDGAYQQAVKPVPHGWRTLRKGPWFNYLCEAFPLRKQGWKIHVSARLENAQEVLDVTSGYCLDKQISFKFLVNRTAFVRRNLKYADRGGSGKFITIYPASDEQCEELLRDLDPKLQGMGGAYILSDLRWQDGPLYLRYGGFVEWYTRNEFGEPVPAIEGPDGTPEVDRRDPVFTVPDWVEPPAFLREHLHAREDNAPPPGFDYEIESALHFSNGGGVYLATQKSTGRKVVLKEARPNAGLDQLGRDSVARLGREHDFLTRLADLDATVNCYDYFTLWEHHFLVQEHVEGTTLNKRLVAENPLIRTDPSEETVAEYTIWAVDMADQIDAVVADLHSRGVAFGDLHPNNIMVTEDGAVRLVDFELATIAGEEQRIGMGAPGYVPPDRRDSVAADLFALGCIKISLFLPLTTLFSLDSTKARMLVDVIEERFPVPAGWGATVLRQLDLGPCDWAGTAEQMARTAALIAGAGEQEPGEREPDGPEIDWPRIEASMARAVWDSATPDRTDRLFPGDVEQFSLTGLGFGYGAAGVLYALAFGGHGREERYERWLLDRVRDHTAPHRLGFYDGLHGIAYAFEEIGRRDAALEVLELAAQAGDVSLADELLTGRSGVALNQLFFARRLGDRELRQAAVDGAERLAERLAVQPPQPEDERGRRRRAGLLHGTSGTALLFVRLFEETGESTYLDLAERALRYDLDCCVHVEEQDVLYVDEGWRSMPYIGTGSAGIGLVLSELLRYRDDEELRIALNRIRRVAYPEFHICPMVFNGTAGQMGFLHHLREFDTDTREIDRRIAIKRDWLRMHMVGLRGDVAIPGDQLMRLSMDFGTGSAGVLHALHTIRDDSREILPFLKPFSLAEGEPGR